jgi:hypothetical protein
MPRLNAIGIVASNMGRSISFYRLLGVDAPDTSDEGHVDTFLPNDAGFHGEKEPWDPFWGQHYAQLQDPVGVGVDLYAAL